MKTTKKRPYPHFKFPNEINISYKEMTESECQWFNVPKGSFQLTTTNYGWFPTQVLMGVVDGKFKDTKGIGATIGGNMGTMSLAVKNLKESLTLLKKEGYNIIN